MKRVVVDIESNDLLENMLDFSSLPYKLKIEAKLWCIVVRDIATGEVVTLKSSSGNTISKEAVSTKNVKIYSEIVKIIQSIFRISFYSGFPMSYGIFAFLF